MTILISALEGGETKVGEDELEQLRASLRGDVLTPADDDYDANPIYNAMHNRRRRSRSDRPARLMWSTR